MMAKTRYSPSWKAKVVLAVAAAVSAGVLLSSAAVYIVVRHDLYHRVDAALRREEGLVFDHGITRIVKPRKATLARLSELPTLVQVVDSKGVVIAAQDASVHLPVTALARKAAAGRGNARGTFENLTISSIPVRMLVAPYVGGQAIQVIKPVGSIRDELSRLFLVLVIVSSAGILFALLLGLVVAGAALRPIRRLTGAVETVKATGDLHGRIEVGKLDEIGRLAYALNSMLGVLEATQRSQRQLVADASHELRTPLAGLRTNVEVLAENKILSAAERAQLVVDVREQFDNLSLLVGDLVDLAREDESVAASGPDEIVDLDEVVMVCISRIRLAYPDIPVESRLEPTPVNGSRTRLERAVSNILDNAAKWSLPGKAVAVTLLNGELSIRDSGPGMSPKDLEHAFDRFYRGQGSRQVPGFGLGLAITRRIVEAHGGTVAIQSATQSTVGSSTENEEGSYTRVIVRLPVSTNRQSLS
ncbi:MAG: HAMP domain-containing sensor histidine kinase [Acidimicrobiales bacterium]